MSIYPTTPKPSFPLEISCEYKTIITQFESGRELAHQQWRFPRRYVNLKYTVLTASELQILWNFYKSQRGAYLPFWFFDEYTRDDYNNPVLHMDEFVGRGDGLTTAFDLPGKNTLDNTTYLKIYLDGVVTSAVAYQLGTGEGGADRVIFDSPPASGVLITADFNGYLRLRMRFAEDNLSYENFTVRLHNIGITLIERKPF